MATTINPCPSCGSTATRPLTKAEWRERCGGNDSLVVVMPWNCAGCGHVWEPPLSRPMCYVVAALGGIGFVIGTAIAVSAIWLLVEAARMPAGGANNLRNRTMVSGYGLAGLGLAGGSGAMCRRYWRRAAAREPTKQDHSTT